MSVEIGDVYVYAGYDPWSGCKIATTYTVRVLFEDRGVRYVVLSGRHGDDMRKRPIPLLLTERELAAGALGDRAPRSQSST